MAGSINLLGDFRIVGRVFADFEEDAGGALLRQRLQHRRRVALPGAVVEGEDDLLLLEEVQLLEMLEAKTRTARGIDLDRAGDAERVRIVASCARGLWRLGLRGA